MNSTDIVIVGGGCVGLTAALGLAKQGHKVTVIDKSSSQINLSEPLARVSALSVASQHILSKLGAWSLMSQDRLQQYDSMSVWEKESFGNINFDAKTVNQTHLGHIVENDNIRLGLIKAAEAETNIQLLFDTEITSLHNSPEQVLLTLSSGGSPIIAKLLIAADGANSWVKKQLNASTTFSDYDHHAIVANITTEQPHQNCARQVFLKDGPLALLPLYDSSCSIVWSTHPDHADQLMAASDEDFAKAVTAATDSVLGVCTVTTQRVRFPLTMRYTQQWVDERVVYIGDAAHTIHPLAGLGMNLGLLDAASLVDCIAVDGAKALTGNNEPALLVKQLRRYERWRKAEAQTVIAAMASLKNLFEGSHPIKKLIRGVGLKLTDKTPVVKHQIIERAMGIKGELPELARFVDPI